jgi:hypothetical protein
VGLSGSEPVEKDRFTEKHRPILEEF